MNSQAKNKVLIFIITVLLLTNMAVLVYFLWFKQSPKINRNNFNRDGMAESLKKEVGFNNEQVAQYKQIRDKQWDTMRMKFDDLRKAKDSLFNLIGATDVPDSTLNSAAGKIAERQKALDLQTFNHFRAVRQLCTPDQLPKYDSLVKRMFHRVRGSFRRSDRSKSDSARSK